MATGASTGTGGGVGRAATLARAAAWPLGCVGLLAGDWEVSKAAVLAAGCTWLLGAGLSATRPVRRIGRDDAGGGAALAGAALAGSMAVAVVASALAAVPLAALGAPGDGTDVLRHGAELWLVVAGAWVAAGGGARGSGADVFRDRGRGRP